MNVFKMPEPNGALYEYKSRQGKPFVYYTADQLRQAAHDALEMAALRLQSDNDNHSAVIRALKEQIK